MLRIVEVFQIFRNTMKHPTIHMESDGIRVSKPWFLLSMAIHQINW